MKQNYNKTLVACFIGYIVQAIINNLLPLLFLTLHESYNIPLSQITLLITVNFGIQLLIDLVSISFIDKIGYRTSILLAHGFSAAGLIFLAILPQLLGNSFVGLLIAVSIYAVGGGLLEVLVSPIVEACPTDNKEKAMSLLHSFYCWGCVAVVLLSTLFFTVFGTSSWRILVILWALVPLINGIFFLFVPINNLIEENQTALTIKQLFSKKVFWLMMLLMICAGACEQSISQWASTFAEKGLGVSKSVGDLTGPAFFSILMGTSRAIYGKYGHKFDLNKFMLFSGILCIISYFMISLTSSAVFGLLGCGLCGLSVGILWPGTFSMSAVSIKGGGTAMFAFLALAGDVGCSGGPTLVGFVSNAFNNNLKIGILSAIIFPVALIICIILAKNIKTKSNV